jgi:glutamate--cysteine ligase
MSGEHTETLRDIDHVRTIVADACFPARLATSPGRVGLEFEAFPIRVAADGSPVERTLVSELAGLLDQSLLDLLATAGHAAARSGGDPAWTLAGGGSLTFEPGGQLEHSTAPHQRPSVALSELDRIAGALARALAPHGVVLASAGADVWTGHPVPQQLRSPRYPAMAAYFEQRGPHGTAMMRGTCALQVNLDLGPPGERDERWLVANLVAPLACATFAASPASGAVSARALIWQRLDPTRTGFPPALVDGSAGDPVDQLVAAALAADVLLVRRDQAGWVAGRPGWTFADWLRGGHPDHGAPTDDDLRYHLTTLFLEVRPRGFLELRALDALPARLRAVPVVLLTGLMDDPRARSQVRLALERYRERLPALWRRAATTGVADPALCALAVETWSSALDGAARLPPGHLPPGSLDQAEAFLDRLTLRGRCPADELRAALADGPARALAWATQPLTTRTRL